MVRTGAEYIAGLKDGRQVLLDGEVVDDVTTHPAFAGIVQTIAANYDFVADPANRETNTFPSPATGEPVNYSFLIPTSEDDLRRRRIAIRKVQERSFGLVGRGPEHVAGFLSGWAGRSDVFARAGEEYGERIRAFHAYIRDNDLYTTYSIVPPQIDRSKPAHQQEDPYLYAGVKEEREDGIVISGAQMLATAGVVSDWLILSSIVPLAPGDDDYAINVAVPMSAPGLKLLSRRGYAAAASSIFDYPLTSQFDETDVLAIFEDVFVPWDKVFIYKNLELTMKQWSETPAHLLGNNQAQIRMATKLDFLTGIARKIAEMNGSINFVRTTLGELAAYTSLVHASVYAQEQNCDIDEYGVAWPAKAEEFAVMVWQSELMPKVVQMVRELCGGGLIQLPSSVKDFESEATRPYVDKYVQSPGHSAQERVKLMKLAWDLVGSEYASRNIQYEMFYVGAPHAVRGRMFAMFDWDRATGLVDSALSGYDLDGLTK